MPTVSAPVLPLPFVTLLPDQPAEAVQLLAFVEVQLSVDEAPLLTPVGLALRLTVGLGAVVTRFTWIENAGRAADF